jgi:hypothetical protein
MDKANAQNQLYPPHLQRVQLTERDDLQTILQSHPRRFDIRTPPSPCHLSTAECLAWVVSRVEDDPTLYDTFMKPLDCMVQKWRDAKSGNTKSRERGRKHQKQQGEERASKTVEEMECND